MRKLLVICGPTATGKTSLAVHLAKVFDGELISADSRQVYKRMDIGTGKDLPSSSKFPGLAKRSQVPSGTWRSGAGKVPRPRQAKPGTVWNLAKRGGQSSKLGSYYEIGGVKLWGYDLVDPTEEFSVGQYVKIVDKIIDDIWERGKLPILVGGTGFYIKGVVDGIPTVSIPKNEDLRQSMGAKKVSELFEILAQLDPVKAASMNVSDKKNSRRLIRAIEVARWKLETRGEKRPASHFTHRISTLFIGLKAPGKVLFQRIDKRVAKRIRQGFEKEIEKLLIMGVSWKTQSMTSLGYKQWKDYFSGEATKDEVVSRWKKEEKKYARRQIAWLKRDKRILWFNIADKGWERKVERIARKWYHMQNSDRNR